MTLTFTYGPDSKPIAGIKIIMTESDGTITVLTTDANGQITLPSTTNTYTLEASLAETGSDPISVQDALYILQHIVELRTLDADQISPGDIIVLSAFGGGVTWGSIVLKWGERTERLERHEGELPPTDATVFDLIEPNLRFFAELHGLDPEDLPS